MNPCRTCLWRRFGERKEVHFCYWRCAKYNREIGDGSDEALAEAKGCRDWTDDIEEVVS